MDQVGNVPRIVLPVRIQLDHDIVVMTATTLEPATDGRAKAPVQPVSD